MCRPLFFSLPVPRLCVGRLGNNMTANDLFIWPQKVLTPRLMNKDGSKVRGGGIPPDSHSSELNLTLLCRLILIK